MRRDPARVRRFMGRWYGWANAHGMPTRKFSPAEFWTCDAVLKRIEAVVSAHMKAPLSGKHATAEDFIFEALDESAKAGVLLDWTAFLKSWKGLFVRLGIKPETIQSTYSDKKKPVRGKANGGNKAPVNTDAVAVKLTHSTEKEPTAHATVHRASHTPLIPSVEMDFALSTWMMYKKSKPKSDQEVIEFHRKKCAELTASRGRG